MKVSEEDRVRALLYYVPTGTTEGEKHILREAFVQTDEYAEIVTPPPGSPRLLVGKKGSGKSAILDFTLNFVRKSGVPALLIKPMDLDFGEISPEASSGELTRLAYGALVRAIAANTGAQLDGFLTGPKKILYQEAVSAGARDLDLFGKVTRLMAALASPLTGSNLSELLPNTDKAAINKLERAVRENAEQSSGAFYLLVDDTDQIASPSVKGHLNRIWAFFLAARELTSRIDKVRCIITLRDEVWRALAKENVGQRDQWDHFLRLVHHLNPDVDHIERIVEKRLILAAARCGTVATKAPYRMFFEGDSPRMPTSEQRSSWPDIIKTRSRERPRDAVQLINMLAKQAASPLPALITEDTLASVMPIYSKERADLLAQEFERECPSLDQVLRSFAGVEYDNGSFLASAGLIRKHLSTLPSAFSLSLDGRVLRPCEDEDAFRLWAFLYSIGLMYPRVSDSRQPAKYRFVNPQEEPDFVAKDRWNDMQKALWEVHPVYRDYLIAVQRDEAAQFGLPTKRKPGKRR